MVWQADQFSGWGSSQASRDWNCQARVQVQGLSQISNKRHGPGACSYNCNVTITAYQRIHGKEGHKKSIIKGNLKNTFAKHISIYHPEKKGDYKTFKFNVKSTHKSWLERQITEGVMIHNSEADIVLNGKSEFHQPSTKRVNLTSAPRQKGLN